MCILVKFKSFDSPFFLAKFFILPIQPVINKTYSNKIVHLHTTINGFLIICKYWYHVILTHNQFTHTNKFYVK